ncbi:MAG: DUF1428 domain-containing protein [Devosia sp.]
MTYIDSFVLAVPRANLDAYKNEVQKVASVWKEHGALTYTEYLGDDAPLGSLTSFPRSVQLKDGEVVVLGMATYPDRATRDKANKAVMSDPRMGAMMGVMKGLGVALDRMYFGGFASIVEG